MVENVFQVCFTLESRVLNDCRKPDKVTLSSMWLSSHTPICPPQVKVASLTLAEKQAFLSRRRAEYEEAKEEAKNLYDALER